MLEHGLPGSHYVAAAEGGENSLSVAQPLQAICPAGDMDVELLPQWTAVHVVPDAFNRRQQHLILRGGCQHQMKHLAVVLAVVIGGDRPLLLLDDATQVVDVGAGRHFCSKSGDVAFEQLARL